MTQKMAIPAFVPAAVRPLMGHRFTLPRLPEEVRRRMRTPEKIAVSKYARMYRVVADGPHQGPWRHHLTPHAVRIMDAFGKPWVREIWYCGSEQSGKTQTMLNCLHWAVDVSPGDVFYLMPTESTAQKAVQDKLMPLLRRSRRLKRLLSDRADDMSLTRIRLKNGVTIRPAWANSAASLASFPAKYAFADETDKFPEMVGKEAGPVELLRKRNRLYNGRYKRFFASTPAQGVIYQGMMNCQQVWEMRQRCPHCGQLFRPEGKCLSLPDGTSAENLDWATPISYACTECGGLIDEAARQELLQEPTWVCIKGESLSRPATVGWHHRAWDCRDVPLYEIAAAWLRAQHGGVAEKIAWANGYEVENYEIEHTDLREDFILRLRDDSLPRGLVPADTSCIIITADTQQVGFHYAVWAFGWGEDLPMALIEHGYLVSFGQLADLASRPRLDAAGRECWCDSGWIDSGGGTDPLRPQHSRTSEVYRFCRANPFWRPIKGARKIDGAWGWTAKNIEFYPSRSGRVERIPGGLLLYRLDVTLWKNEAARKLMIEPEDPGTLRLYADVTSEYGSQLCAEYRDERGWWICPSGKANHQWDCLVYAMFAANFRHVRDWQRPAPGTVSALPRQGDAVVYSKGVQI